MLVASISGHTQAPFRADVVCRQAHPGPISPRDCRNPLQAGVLHPFEPTSTQDEESESKKTGEKGFRVF